MNEASSEKKAESRYALYSTRRSAPKTKVRGEQTYHPKFRVSYKELLGIPGIVEKLKFPQKTNRNLGLWREVWCEFHNGFGHEVQRCIALGNQLTSLVKDGFLKEYLETNQEDSHGEDVLRD